MAASNIPNIIEMGPSVLFREGVDAHSLGHAQDALQYFRQVLKHARKSGDQNNIAWALLHIGMILRERRQSEDVLDILEDAGRIFSGLRNDLGRAAVLQELSLANRELERNSLALEYAHQSLKIYQDLGKTLDLAWGYDNMAVIHLNLYRRHESLTYAKKARELFLEFGSEQGLAWNSCNLGQLYHDMGFYAKAERYYSGAAKTFSQLKNKQGEAWANLGLAMVHRSQYRFDVALNILEKSKTTYKELDLKDRVGWCLLNESAIKYVMGQDEDAILLNKRALQLFSPLRNHGGVGWALFQIGRILRDRGQWLKAWQTFRESLNLQTDINNKKGIAWTENDWGETYLELNDLSHARECLVKAKVQAEQLGELPLKADVEKNLARLNMEDGLLQRGAESLEQVEALSRRIQARQTEAEILLERARFFIVIGDLVKARQCIRQASGLVQIYNLNRLKPAVGICLGEVLVGEGQIANGVKVWRDVIQESTKLQQKRHRAEALLGIIQVLSREKLSTQLAIMLFQADKDIRALSSRKLRGKYLAVKGWVTYQQSKVIDTKSFTQALQILQTTGLPVCEKHVLGALAEVYRQLGKDRERQECEASLKHLLDRGSVDLHLVIPRHAVFKNLPISVVA